jgi:DNA adenine methylase
MNKTNTTKTTKPILKWVGGKTQILDKLLVEFPPEMNNYHEIFLGGGSVLLALLIYIKKGNIKVNGKICAYDINEPLIYLYKNIQSVPNELYTEIQQIIHEFNECPITGIVNRTPVNIVDAMQTKENYYYWTRNKYNKLSSIEKNSINGSAIFVFLNKTCFRGIFRLGPNGFNVPYGHNKNPEIINLAHLIEMHLLVQGVVFECCDFTTSLSNIEKDDFIYMDPPYSKETNTSFVGYTENGFNIETQMNLFGLLHNLSNDGKNFILSNADVSLVRDSFTNDEKSNEPNTKKKYNIISILCKRRVNSKNPGSTTQEVIIKNY